MSGTSRYARLFESVKIGPVTAPNRFYQVPHCTGMGHALPQTLVSMRAMKAEGGWGVVCTEYCSIHPSSDDHPYPFASLWDDGDIGNLAAMADALHAHGALAGIELWHGGSYVANLASREPTYGVRSALSRTDPVQSQRMDRRDIRAFRRWHLDAALRAKRAGFDIIYVYPSHGYLVAEFLSRSCNERSDEYGGSLENRMRLMRELLDETRTAVGDRCAIATRFAANGHGDEHLSEAEARDVVAALGHMPDLWDVVLADYDEEMGSSRFVRQGALEDRVAYVRRATGKPVVCVGRFTSPDAMLGQLQRGVLDLIGAARPSIADPFLPNKIRADRLEDIRECIGCNICYAHNFRGSALRCTQNPTLGEEWRSGWHPEKVAPGDGSSVLIVGAGPAGLEAAQVLGKRGYAVALADAADEAGGRVTRESRLPGLAEWARVRDYRLGQISRMPNVSLYLGNRLQAAEVREFGADHVLIATGARWRRDGIGRWHARPIITPAAAGVHTPDDLMDGAWPGGEVLVFDDDHYYMGPVLAQQLAAAGARVRYVTTEGRAGSWSLYTQEQERTQRALLELGVEIEVNACLTGFAGGTATLACIFSGREWRRAADALVLVTAREPDEALYRELVGEGGGEPRADGVHDGEQGDPGAGGQHIRRIGDCQAPGLIAHAVYAGHRAARELGGPRLAPRRERVLIREWR
ncbi:MAG: FAD-dependent oxidoreductase [Gammaproteobacteria bacterium]|nr:FAD-dependent oxidoreductase [Gammaproteobacteria bacterium]